MQMYTPTPDYYNDYIQHGWLKDQAAKVHKYIERWRGKNGKWYYRYKSKAQELKTKINRSLNEDLDDYYNKSEAVTTNYGKKWLPARGRYSSTGRPNSRFSGKHGVNVNEGIRAGRKRAKIAQNLTDKGYPNSKKQQNPKRKTLGYSMMIETNDEPNRKARLKDAKRRKKTRDPKYY